MRRIPATYQARTLEQRYELGQRLRRELTVHWQQEGAPPPPWQLPSSAWNLKTVQELLGHADIRMTMRYAQLAPEAKDDAVRLSDEPEGGPAVGDILETAIAG